MHKKIIAGICAILVIAFVLYKIFKNSKKEYMGQKILTFYYSPTCGHCRAFENTWKDFKKIADKLSVGTAEINCLENETACQNIQAFPTLILENNGKQTKFNEARSIENLTKFIQNN